ncbi:LexA repressor [Spirochaetia bacterium]|nr:LexA repressor [Spirochaetia bacterium]
MKELTQRQQKVLVFITEYINAHEYAPTIREIADHFEVSVKGAYDHVAALKKKGHIAGGERSRTITIVRQEDEAADDAFERVPLLGTVAAGIPILAEENWNGTIPVHRSMLKKRGPYFALKVRGDSMEGAGIMDGDTAIIEKRDMVNNGEIAIVMVDDDEARTVKRFFKESNRVRLQPENAKYSPIYSRNVRVLGRVAHVIRSY